MLTRRKFVPVMLTPFHKDGTIDYDGLSALTAFYIEAGAGCLFTNCLSSEMFELSKRERLDITAHVVKAAAGAVPVFSTGTFSSDTEEQAAFVKEIYETGVAAVVIITGVLASEEESDSVLDDRVFQLLEKTENIPFGFYECPVPYKRLLKAEQLGRFAATGRVIYHKDTSLCLDNVRSKLAASSGYAFELYDAYMVNAVASLRAGAAGLTCIQGNYFPELITWICNHFSDPALEEEVQLAQRFLTRNMEVMHAAYPLVAKYFLQKRGIRMELNTRKRGVHFSDNEKQKMDLLFDNYQVLQREIGIDA